MYDVDGNGIIEKEEMSRIVQSIYAMMGPDQSLAERQMETAEQRAENIFKRMDINSDGKVEKREFVRCCMQDSVLHSMSRNVLRSCWRQQSYAIKNQLGHPKPNTKEIGRQKETMGLLACPTLVLYGIRIVGFHAWLGPFDIEVDNPAM